jgi:hypothetical protein
MKYSLKAISIGFGGDGLISEGLREIPICARVIFCDEFLGANPQRSDHCGVRWNFF